MWTLTDRARALLCTCFFASGATGLILEVAWARQASYLLGNGLHAAAAVAAAFLGGLAIGAWTAARVTSYTVRPIRTYAIIQACIGAYAIVSIPLLRAIEPLVDRFADPGAAAALPPLGLTLVFAVVGVPAALMGMTLPLLARAVVRGLEEFSSPVGMLYSLNTLGAVAGTVLAGFVLLPFAGLSATCLIAGAIDFSVGLIALRLDTTALLAPAEAPDSSRCTRNWRQRLVAALFAFSGVAALTYEVGWFRLLALTVGPSTQAFSAMLAVYLAGLALGSGLASAVMPRLRVAALTLFGVLECLVALVVALTAFALNRLPRLQVAVFSSADAMLGAAGPAISLILVAAAIVFVPCLLMGALFPVTLRAFADLGGDRSPQHDVGWLYGLNTVGAIAGSIAAAFFFIPVLGTWKTLLGAAIVSVTIGFTALVAAAGTRRMRVIRAMAAPIVVGGLLWHAPSWDVRTFNAGAYRHAYARRAFDFEADAAVLYFREGLNFSVAVLAMDGEASLRITGKADASTGLLDRATQALLGHVPMLIARHSSKVAVVGYGSGGTAAAILAHPGVDSLTILELEPAVLEASRFFAPINHGALEDPRVRVILADARAYLARTRETFDVISAEPSNPWLAGMGSLFTVAFFETVRERLTRDGVFCQWIQSYEISDDVFRAIVGSLHEVFPHLVLVRASAAGDWMVLASANPIAAPWETVASRFAAAQVQESLRRIGLTHPLQLAAHVRATSDALSGLVGPAARRVTDDDVWLEYRAFSDLVSGAAAGRSVALDTTIASAGAGQLLTTWGRVLPGIPAALCVQEVVRYLYAADLVHRPAGDPFDPLQRDREVVLRGLRAEIAARGDDRLQAVFESADHEQHVAWARRVEGTRVLGGTLPGSPRERFTTIARVLEASPDLAEANVMAGRILADGGIYPEAEALLRRVLRVPVSVHYYDALIQLGNIGMRQGSARAQEHWAQSIHWYRQAIAWNPYRAEAFVALSEVYRAQGKPEAADAVLHEGRTFNPQHPEIVAAGMAVERARGDSGVPHGGVM